MLDQQVAPWSSTDAAEMYDVGRWGAGYFSVGKAGNLLVHPTKDPGRFIDLKQLIDNLQLRGIDTLREFQERQRQAMQDGDD